MKIIMNLSYANYQTCSLKNGSLRYEYHIYVKIKLLKNMLLFLGPCENMGVRVHGSEMSLAMCDKITKHPKYSLL